MAIRQDNSDLPRPTQEGNPPDPTPTIGQMLAESWGVADEDERDGHVASREGRYIRLGWGGKCARDIGYRLLGVEPSNPPDLAARWRMGLGTRVHELLQDVIAAAFPNADIEKVVGAEHDTIMGIPTSGRTDLFIVDREREKERTAVEVKTINGFGFKMAVGARGTPEGPRTGALFQAALNGRAHQADQVKIILLSLECLSDRELESLVKKQGGTADSWRKFVAEWTYDMADLDEMVDRELKRLGKIIEIVDERADWLVKVEDASAHPDEAGTEPPLPPRSIPFEMPARARVTDPTTGAWQLEVDGNVMDAGKTWMCAGYCDYRDQCVKDGPS